MSDPWKHRSAGMTCSTCMWYVEKFNTTKTKTVIGRCRRHAPTMNGYPVVYPTDWCGDHKLDEEKTPYETKECYFTSDLTAGGIISAAAPK